MKVMEWSHGRKEGRRKEDTGSGTELHVGRGCMKSPRERVKAETGREIEILHAINLHVSLFCMHASFLLGCVSSVLKSSSLLSFEEDEGRCSMTEDDHHLLRSRGARWRWTSNHELHPEYENAAWAWSKIVSYGLNTLGFGFSFCFSLDLSLSCLLSFSLGLDADLIMLALASHEPHFVLLREEVVFGSIRGSWGAECLSRKLLRKRVHFNCFTSASFESLDLVCLRYLVLSWSLSWSSLQTFLVLIVFAFLSPKLATEGSECLFSSLLYCCSSGIPYHASSVSFWARMNHLLHLPLLFCWLVWFVCSFAMFLFSLFLFSLFWAGASYLLFVFSCAFCFFCG